MAPGTVPPIALKWEEANVTLNKGEYADFKLLTDPDDKDSLEYTLSLPYFKKGSPEDWLIFHQTLKKVFWGLNIQNGANVVPIVSDVRFGESPSDFHQQDSGFLWACYYGWSWRSTGCCHNCYFSVSGPCMPMSLHVPPDVQACLYDDLLLHQPCSRNQRVT